MYFVVGSLFLFFCKVLEKRKLLEQILISKTPNKNIPFEVKNSLVSIFIFGFSGVLTVYLIRSGIIILAEITVLNTLFGLLILVLWNELHFFLIHKMLHIPFLYRTVHKIHHQSKVPTVYSVYSFHWIEATLLSTVPITIAPFIDFSPTAIFIFPFLSILLNYSGHCNYRFGNGNGATWKVFGTRHAQHHYRNTKNYGFVTHLFDQINSIFKNTNKQA
ncbi:MAG: sterol desaturase family protein [Bacteroidota bacterium]